MKKDFDHILKQALTPQEEPDAWLNQNILYRASCSRNFNWFSIFTSSNMNVHICKYFVHLFSPFLIFYNYFNIR